MLKLIFSLHEMVKITKNNDVKMTSLDVIFLSKEIKVSASYVTKKYEMHKKKSDKTQATLKKNKKKNADFWAIRGVSFEVMAGEAIGLIGTNGSGKSTLSNIIAGATSPTTGEIMINGKTSIIAIGAGLNKQLTGRENIRLKCLLAGMSNKEINSVMDDIIAFSDLDDFIDQPIKNYSSGMKSRLGFSISVHNNPDILIIDEALSVGDKTFNQRCVDKIYDFKAQGKTIFFVSHSLSAIKNLCDRVIWMHDGEMKQFGPTEEVITAYQEYVEWYKKLPKKEQLSYNIKQKKERSHFDIDHYYQQIISQLEFSHSDIELDQIKNMFDSARLSNKMELSSKLLIASIIVGLLMIVLNHVPTRPITEIISEVLS